jgi:hypothetical protein
MNLSDIVDEILLLRLQSESPEGRIAEYLASSLADAGATVYIQRFIPVELTRIVVGAVVLLLSIVFVASVVRRWRRIAFISALAIPLILVLELSFDIHPISWAVAKRDKNVIAHFAVQNAARRVVIGTHYGDKEAQPPTRFALTVSAFLLPISLVTAVLGLWHLVAYFAKFEFEDARTVSLAMGCVCVAYYALWLGTGWARSAEQADSLGPAYNVGSLAVLSGVAQDLAQRYPRLETTAVTVAFFGDDRSESDGARRFVRKVLRRRSHTLPAYFVGCQEIGRGGPHAYVIPNDDTPAPPYGDWDLVRVINRVAVAATGQDLKTEISAVGESRDFAEYGYPAVAITSLPERDMGANGGARAPESIDRGQLLLSVQLLEKTLLEFDRSTNSVKSQ